MVTRKPSLPYPTSPPPPPPDSSHHNVDTTDVPPVPNIVRKSTAAADYDEMGNPWSEEYSSPAKAEGKFSNNSRSGAGEQQPPNKLNLQNLPDVLRPGWSGEATPRSSLESDGSPEREWWDDDDEEEKNKENNDTDKPTEKNSDNDGFVRISKEKDVPESLQVKRKPVGSTTPPFTQVEQPSSNDFSSNNPFRKASASQDQIISGISPWNNEPKGKGRETEAQHPQMLPPLPQFANLSLSQQGTNGPMHRNDSTPPAPSQPPPPVPEVKSPFSEQPPLIPVSPKPEIKPSPWASQSSFGGTSSPAPFEPAKQHITASTDNLLDRGGHRGSVSLGDELKALPNAPNAPAASHSEISLLEDEEPRPSFPSRTSRRESNEMYAPPPGPPPPMKPPRPAIVTKKPTEEEIAQMIEQRNETYSIKHFDWYDQRSGKMRRSSMLTQNKNGPCPLLALVNALILGATEDTQAALDDALRQREQVSLGLIIETLMDELLTRALQMSGNQLPDVDELNRFLMRLRTGMNANPRFAPKTAAPNLMDADSPTVDTPAPQYSNPAGTFESTSDIKLYESFKVKLVHGWLPRPGDEASAAFGRTAQTYEDAQAVQFGEEELEYKLSNNGLTQHEQQVWEDITSIKTFLRAFPTQLTPYGLESVTRALERGEFAILFRNDHFSTIYKHPQDGKLYTLITDAGYADRAEVIWESLVDINGARSEFYSGDFKSVSHGDSAHAMPHSQTAAANPGRSSTYLNIEPTNQPPMSPQEQQEQHDADFAMALQLQEEEEQRMRQERAQSQSQSQPNANPSQNPSPNIRGGRRAGRRSTSGNIPIPLRGNPSSTQEIRPIIPPRTQQNRNQGVNRPSDANQEDAPPAYEEAAKGRPYVPPIGSPLHPSSSAEASAGARGSSSNVNLNAGTQNQTSGVVGGNRPQRRSSAYMDNSSAYYPHQSTPDYSARPHHPNPYGAGELDSFGMPRRDRDRERDCIVM